MTSKLLLGTASVAALSLALAGTAAMAQSRSRAASGGAPAAPAPAAARPAGAAAAAPPPLISGPPIAGVCLFSEERAVATSSAGQAANTRMNQLKAQVQAELQPEGKSLQDDIRTFQAQRATLTGDALNQRQDALQGRAQTLQQKDQLRGQELQATGQKALGTIRQALDPAIRRVYEARKCSLLLNADGAVFAGNPAMDITADVVTGLNAALPTISFDREHLDQGAGQPAAAAPARK